MPMERIEITRRLRQLIRMQRTDRAQLTQAQAAEQAGLSLVWWRHIESGHTDYATAETLARMSRAVGVTPEQLRKVDQDHVADLVEDRDEMLGPDDDMESHLMKTPGLTEAQRVALVTMANVLRST